MARAAKSPARARPKGYAAPTNGKATKKSSAARTSTKFLLLALVVLYATPSSLLLLSNPLLFFAIGAHNFMGILNFYYTCEPVNSVCAKVHDRLMTFLIEQSKVPGPHQVVAEVDASDPRVATGEVWKELTENFRKPMVVRGLFKGAPALEKWASWEYFADRFGDDKYSFLLEDRSNASSFRSDARTKTSASLYNGELDWRRMYSKGALVSQSKLRDVVAEIKDGAKHYLSGSALSSRTTALPHPPSHTRLPTHTHLPVFALRSSAIFFNHPELLDDMEFAQRIPKWIDGQPYLPPIPNLWMGPGGTGTDWHTEQQGNVYVQVHGKKKWGVMQPEHSVHARPALMRQQPNAHSTWDPNATASGAITYFTLEPGDLMINPPWVWHSTHNDPTTTLSVAVSTREIMYWPTLRNMPLWTLAQELSPDCNYNVASARNWLAWGLARSPFFLLLFNSFLEILVGYFPKDAFNARDLTKCPEVNKIFGIEVEPRFCTPTNVDGQQDDTTGDEYKAK